MGGRMLSSIVVFALNHWRAVVICLLLAVPSLYAAVMKHQRDDARATITEMVVAGRVAEEHAKAEIDRQKSITEGVDNDHKKRTNRLASDNQRLRGELHQLAGRSVVPAISDATDGGDDSVACFERGVLNAELEGVLQRFADRLVRIAGEGESVSAAFAACSEWAIGEAGKRH